MIPLFKPSVSQKEIDAVTDVLKSGWWGLGTKTKEFEERFAAYVGTGYAVSLNSATAALHLSLNALNLPPRSEVITTPITFISTAFAIHYNGLKPIFADICPDTLNLNPEDVYQKITPKTKVLLPVHFGGHICDMDPLMAIASEYGLSIVEDAAHAAGSSFNGKMAGTFGKFGCFSFHAVKNLATGDGGMITTDDKEAYARLNRLRWLGINKSTSSRTASDHYSWDYDVEEIGYKCHGNDILSSIGLAQLERLEKINDRRRKIFTKYNSSLRNVVEVPVWKKGVKSACHNYVVKAERRDELISHLGRLGISAGVHYKPLYRHPFYHGLKADCPVADRIWGKLVSLPIYPDMTEEESDSVIDGVRSFYSSSP